MQQPAQQVSPPRFQAPGADKPTTGSAFDELEAEFMEAALSDPARHVRTPDSCKRMESIADLVYDAFSGKDGEQLLINTMRIVSLAAKSSEPALAKVAKLYWEKLAKAHAEYHADALTLALEDDQ